MRWKRTGKQTVVAELMDDESSSKTQVRKGNNWTRTEVFASIERMGNYTYRICYCSGMSRRNIVEHRGPLHEAKALAVALVKLGA